MLRYENNKFLASGLGYLGLTNLSSFSLFSNGLDKDVWSHDPWKWALNKLNFPRIKRKSINQLFSKIVKIQTEIFSSKFDHIVEKVIFIFYSYKYHKKGEGKNNLTYSFISKNKGDWWVSISAPLLFLSSFSWYFWIIELPKRLYTSAVCV